MLYAAKSTYIMDKVHYLQGNTKQLYDLVESLTGCKKENPLPEGLSDKELSEKFASFFTGR